MSPGYKNKVNAASGTTGGQQTAKKSTCLSLQKKWIILIVVVISVLIAISLTIGLLLVLNKADDDLPTTTDKTTVTLPDKVIIKNPDTIEHQFEPGCTVMIGTCIQKTCDKVDGLNMCAHVERSETITKTCKSGKTYKVQSALSCKCEVCEDQVITKIIHGRVTSKAKVAIADVLVSIGGVEMDETDIEGNYHFDYIINDFDEETPDLELIFKPLNFSEFLMAKRVLDMNGPGLIYHVDVILQKANIQLSFNPSEAQSIELGESGDSFADIEIPSNSVVTVDGKEVTDQVHYFIGKMDTSNEEDMDYVPDSFTAAENDDTIYSKGMFNSQCITTAGEECMMKQAKVTIPISTDASPEELNNMWIWEFQNGKWVKVQKMELISSDKRRRRRNSETDAVLAATLDLGNEIYNMDYFGVAYCYIKVLAISNKPINAKVKSTYRSNTDWLAYKWNYKNSWNTRSTICAQVPCDSQSTVKYTYLSAVAEDGEQLMTADELPFNAESYGITNVNVSYILHFPEGWTTENDADNLLSGKFSQSQCYESDGPHLIFISNVDQDELNYIPFVEVSLPQGFVQDPMFWWQDKHWYNPCFLSIGIISSNASMKSVQVDIESFGGNVEVVAGQWIGTRNRNIPLDSTTVIDGVTYKYGFDLVEYKCSGKIYSSGDEIDQTLLKISLPGNCKMKKIKKMLQNHLMEDSNGSLNISDLSHDFEIKAPKMSDYISMRNMGIFTNPNWGHNSNHWSFKYAHQSKLVAKESYSKDHGDHSTYLNDIINGTDSDILLNHTAAWEVINSTYMSDFINETFLIDFIETTVYNTTLYIYTNGTYYNTFAIVDLKKITNQTFVLEYLKSTLFKDFVDIKMIEVYWGADWVFDYYNVSNYWEFWIKYSYLYIPNIIDSYFKYNMHYGLFDSEYFIEFLNGTLLENPFPNYTDGYSWHENPVPIKSFLDLNFNDKFVNEGYMDVLIKGTDFSKSNPFAFVFECE